MQRCRAVGAVPDVGLGAALYELLEHVRDGIDGCCIVEQRLTGVEARVRVGVIGTERASQQRMVASNGVHQWREAIDHGEGVGLGVEQQLGDRGIHAQMQRLPAVRVSSIDVGLGADQLGHELRIVA